MMRRHRCCYSGAFPMRCVSPLSLSAPTRVLLLLAALLAAGQADAQPAGAPLPPVIAPPVRRAAPPPKQAPAKPPAKPTPAAPMSDSAEYQACMEQAAKDASAAYETAGSWMVRGGGFAARDCQAVALIRLGSPGEAAARLEAMAEEMGRSGVAELPIVLAQAGQAWLAAGRPERAYAVQTAALKLTPEDSDLLIDRAISEASLKRYKEAIDDLTRVLKQEPQRSEALVYRGTAYRYLGDTKQARADIDKALSLDPRSADALLERGNLKRLAGDGAGARADWLALLRVVDQDAPQAHAARANIEKLDLKTR